MEIDIDIDIDIDFGLCLLGQICTQERQLESLRLQDAKNWTLFINRLPPDLGKHGRSRALHVQSTRDSKTTFKIDHHHLIGCRVCITRRGPSNCGPRHESTLIGHLLMIKVLA